MIKTGDIDNVGVLSMCCFAVCTRVYSCCFNNLGSYGGGGGGGFRHRCPYTKTSLYPRTGPQKHMVYLLLSPAY